MRTTGQSWQELLVGHLVALGAMRQRKDPAKFYFPDRQLFMDTHADGGHKTGPDEQMKWLHDSLVAPPE